MTRTLTTVCGMAVTVLMAVSPGQAQVAVYDAAADIGQQIQTQQDLAQWTERFRYLIETFRKLETVYRDTEEVIERSRGAMQYGDSRTFQGHGARQLYLESFPHDLAITEELILEEGITAGTMEDHWQKVLHDTLYGVFDSVWWLAEDLREIEEIFEELEAQVLSAPGEHQLLRTLGAMESANLREQSKTNQQLAVLTNLMVMESAVNNARRTSQDASLNYALMWDGWDEDIPLEAYPDEPWSGQ